MRVDQSFSSWVTIRFVPYVISSSQSPCEIAGDVFQALFLTPEHWENVSASPKGAKFDSGDSSCGNRRLGWTFLINATFTRDTEGFGIPPYHGLILICAFCVGQS